MIRVSLAARTATTTYLLKSLVPLLELSDVDRRRAVAGKRDARRTLLLLEVRLLLVEVGVGDRHGAGVAGCLLRGIRAHGVVT